MIFQSHPADPQIAYLECHGQFFREQLSNSEFMWLYHRLLKAGEQPRVFDTNGNQINVTCNTIEYSYLGPSNGKTIPRLTRG